MSLLLTLPVALSALNPLFAQEAASDLQRQLGDLDLRGQWFYDDLEGGFAAAKSSGKPLLVAFRCVP
jgi:hypothetical protein